MAVKKSFLSRREMNTAMPIITNRGWPYLFAVFQYIPLPGKSTQRKNKGSYAEYWWGQRYIPGRNKAYKICTLNSCAPFLQSPHSQSTTSITPKFPFLRTESELFCLAFYVNFSDSRPVLMVPVVRFYMVLLFDFEVVGRDGS